MTSEDPIQQKSISSVLSHLIPSRPSPPLSSSLLSLYFFLKTLPRTNSTSKHSNKKIKVDLFQIFHFQWCSFTVMNSKIWWSNIMQIGDTTHGINTVLWNAIWCLKIHLSQSLLLKLKSFSSILLQPYLRERENECVEWSKHLPSGERLCLILAASSKVMKAKHLSFFCSSGLCFQGSLLFFMKYVKCDL